jgi:hypothetical protein
MRGIDLPPVISFASRMFALNFRDIAHPSPFHPLDWLAVNRFLNADMCHCGCRRNAVPMLLVRRKPDDIAATPTMPVNQSVHPFPEISVPIFCFHLPKMVAARLLSTLNHPLSTSASAVTLLLSYLP